MVKRSISKLKSGKFSKTTKKNNRDLILSSVSGEREGIVSGYTDQGLKVSLTAANFIVKGDSKKSTFKPRDRKAINTVTIYDEKGLPFTVSYNQVVTERLGIEIAAGISWAAAALEIAPIAAALAVFVPLATVGSFLIAAYDIFTREAANRRQAAKIVREVVKKMQAIADQLTVNLKSYLDDKEIEGLQGKITGASIVLEDILADWESEDPEVQALRKARLSTLADQLSFFVIGSLRDMVDRHATNLNLAIRAAPLLFNALMLKENILQYFSNGSRARENVITSAQMLLSRLPELKQDLRVKSDLQFYPSYYALKEPGNPTEYIGYFRGAPIYLTTTSTIYPDKALENEKNSEYREFISGLTKFENDSQKALTELLAARPS